MLFIFVTVFTLQASVSYGQWTKISLDLKNVSIEQLIDEIEGTSKFRFIYKIEDVNLDRLVSIKADGEQIQNVLDELFVNTETDFRIRNRRIYLVKRTEKERSGSTKPLAVQELTISGKVTDENSVPLPGASVLEKNTDNGTTTDFDGNYSITVTNPNGVLTISYIGYGTIEIDIENRNTIDVVLESETSALDAVIVVGYGTQKKSDLTGSVATVPEQRLEQVPNLNVAQSIQGAIPGITVTQNQAGAASSESIIIRGRNSILASNGPLIVVDRIPFNGELRDINVNDIESIQVLKDASATAIYGARGSNGVILVTTKEGTVGKTRIVYDGRTSIQQFDRLPNYMSGPEFLEFKEIREPGNITTTEQNAIDNERFVDWQDLALRSGLAQQHNLSISGGTEKVKYFFGGSYLDVKGVTINDDYNRITGRVNLDVKVTDFITLGTKTQYSVDDRSGLSPDFSDLGRKNPLIIPFDDDGELTLFPWPEFTDIGNPLEPINYENTDKSNQILTNNYVIVDFPFLKGLSYRLNTGVTERFTDVSTYRGRNTKAGLEAGGSGNTERTQFSTYVVENIIDFANTFDKHQIGVTGLYSYQQDKTTSNLLLAEGFPNDITSFYNASQAQVIVPEFRFTRTDLISNMMRINYGFDGRYLLTLTGRRDGFSGFGANDKWGTFGTVAAAWTLSNEKFFPWKNTFDFLKFRVSYGENGNQAVGPYESIARFREENFVDGGTSLPGFVPDNLANPRLSWETSTSLNLGLDFEIFNNSISGSVDYFRTNTRDLLLNRTISPVQGIPSIIDNIGETRNSGVEISLNSNQVIGERLYWNTNINFTYIRNEIVSLGLGANGEVDDVASGLFIGEPITSNFDFLFDGVWQQNEAELAGNFDSQPGFVKIRDINGDGAITADDRTIIGQRDPKWLWGMTNTFAYDNLRLSVFIHGVHGVTKENELFQDTSSSSGVRRNVILKNWWTPDNPTNEFYANNVDAGSQQGFRAPLYQEAGFVRLKDVTLSYDLSSRLTEKIGLGRLTFYFTGRNLLTLTDWEESDPELDSGRGTIPLQKEYVFGITLSN